MDESTEPWSFVGTGDGTDEFHILRAVAEKYDGTCTLWFPQAPPIHKKTGLSVLDSINTVINKINPKITTFLFLIDREYIGQEMKRRVRDKLDNNDIKGIIGDRLLNKHIKVIKMEDNTPEGAFIIKGKLGSHALQIYVIIQGINLKIEEEISKLIELEKGITIPPEKEHIQNFFKKICKWFSSCESFKSQLNNDTRLDNLVTLLSDYISLRPGDYPVFDATYQEIQIIRDEIKSVFQSFGGTQQELLPKNEDMPIKFSGEVFANYLEILAQESGVESYVEFLLARIRTMISDTRMKSIIGDKVDITLDAWLEKYIGKDKAENGCVTVINLSLVPTEIIHITIAVIARMIFEALQRYQKNKNSSLPTVIVLEEAHTFIKRYKEDAENQNIASVCCQVFEKIAREGRKFGLGLVLSSQRPSELSSTVLSQCNSFLLHRISNDRDQELVNKLVPDNFRGLLRELPSLPSQNAILLGWASELPVMVKMNYLSAEKRPHSDDPDFWDVWTGRNNEGEEVCRDVDWKKIADEWQRKDVTTNNTGGNTDTPATDDR